MATPSNSLYTLNTPMGDWQLILRIDGQDIIKDDARCVLNAIKIHNSQVEGAILFSIQIHPIESIQQLQAHCRWGSESMVGRGRPESYPGKNALRWNTPTHSYVLATEDVETFKRRSDLPLTLIQQLEEIGPELDHLIFVHRDDGMTIRLSEMKSKEPFQLLFMLVWDSLHEVKNVDHCSTLILENWNVYLTESA